MQSIKIEINGQSVDVDKGRIPLSFSRLVDKWEDFVGSEGTRAKALSDTLYLPATKRNSDILSSFDTYDYNSQATQDLLFVQVFVNGISVFAGYGQRVMISKRGTLRDTFAIKILGDATDVFARIEGLSLRDLPMGDATTDDASIQATWTNVSVNDNPLVFAPIYYGGTNNRGNALAATGYQYTTALRPSVRIWKILEAIFEKQLGYEIVSNIYRTDMFRNLVYPFGVGDDWKRTDDVTPYRCFVGAASGQTNLRPQAAGVKFTIETAPYFDPQNMNVLGGLFRPTTGGWYTFQFNIIGSGIQRVVLRGSTRTNGIVQAVNINLGEYKPNAVNTTEPILFEPNWGLYELIFTVEQDSPTGRMAIDTDSFYKAELTDRFAFPYPLDIASCLHDKAQKDFLKGVQHLFGLVFGIDNINKRVYIDPRFFNATNPITVPEGIINQRDSYYEVESDAQELRLDADTELSHRRPFGDSLTLGFSEDNSDGLYTYLKEQSADNYAIPLYGSKIDFIPSDKQGTVSRNPFFAPLLTIRMYSSSTTQRPSRWGCIVNSFEQDLLTSGVFAPTDAKYSCDTPKIAMYYGVLNLPLDIYAWIYAGTPTTTNAQRLDIPLVLGVFPNETEYMNALGGVPFNVTYSNIYYDYPSPFTSLGLINRYHQKYLAMIYNDKWLAGSNAVDLVNYRTDLFKQPKLVKIGGQLIKCWQAQTNGFNPIEDSKADISLILDYDSIDGATYTETEQGDNPLLTTGYIVEISNTGD